MKWNQDRFRSSAVVNMVMNLRCLKRQGISGPVVQP
jgi:hypothetical protein